MSHILNTVLKASMDGPRPSQRATGVPSELRHRDGPFWHPLSKTYIDGAGRGNGHSESAE